ncbi:MAG: tetratricopeptide repeat protein [Planctomycetota bacterium]
MDDRSILLRIEEQGAAAPRLQLRGSEFVQGEQRYESVGEIARGGVGEVWKSRDVDLGRDVAVKVLLERHMESPEMLQRFIEEAQIGGQLQHPGIVPVYELGLNDEQRPFFAMKLVKGDTLAALLQARPDPSHDRRRVISIFEHICLTVAYAHSRGVVHRDLKPSNVMIGAFGEVQVVDWGFAKVLARGGIADERRPRQEETVVATVRSNAEGSASIAGSVMGTPRYMSPEQALGHVDELDARSDVFSLGAVLCEILTGAPPYRDDDAMLAAAQARLGDAFERLDACGANETLVKLCRDCLGHLPRERPSSARALAEVVTAYLTESETRAHRAQLAAVDQNEQAVRAKARAEQARATAAEQTRRRRHTIAISSTLLAASALFAGIFFWWSNDRSQRESTARAAMSAELEKAERLGGSAEWAGALAAAERARTLGKNADVDVTSVNEVVLRIETEKQSADDNAARIERDRNLVEALEQASVARLDAEDVKRTDEMFEAAFRDAGLEVTAAALSETEQPVRIALFLDEWARLRREKYTLQGKPWKQLLRVSRAIDSDPVRTEARVALEEEDLDRLAAIADRIEQAPAATFHQIASSLKHDGKIDEAITLLGKGLHQHPGDFWLHFSRAIFLNQANDGRTEEAIRHATAAIALRPVWSSYGVAATIASNLERYEEAERLLRITIESPTASANSYADLAMMVRAQDRTEEAEKLCRRALEMDENCARAHGEMGVILMVQGKLEEAERHFRVSVKRRPDYSMVHANFARCLVKMEKYEEADKETAIAIKLNPKNFHALLNRIASFLRRGDPQKAVAAAREAIALGGTKADIYKGLGDALKKTGDPEGAREAFKKATECSGADAQSYRWYGHAQINAGDNKGGLESLTKSLDLEPGNARAHNGVGVALQNLKRVDEAMVHYEKSASINGNAYACRNLGWIYNTRRDFKNAAHWYSRAADAAPDRLNYRAFYGLLLLNLNKDNEALAQFERVLAVNAKFPMALAGAAIVAHRKGEIEKAIRLNERAGNMPTAQNNLAHILLTSEDERHRDPKRALKLARAAVTGNSYWAFRGTKAVALLRNGMLDEALAEFEECARLCPEDERPPTFFHAITLWKLGRKEDARKVYDESVKILKNDADVDVEHKRFRAEADAVMR